MRIEFGKFIRIETGEPKAETSNRIHNQVKSGPGYYYAAATSNLIQTPRTLVVADGFIRVPFIPQVDVV